MSFAPRTAPSTLQIAFFDDTHPSTPAAPVAHTNERTGWSATYSTCTRFRYLLFRPLVNGARDKGRIMWCMMNPSTATEFKNDPTITKCMAFSEAWGYSDIEIANMFGLRSPHPKDLVAELQAGGNPVGAENDRYIIEAAQRADRIVYACGVPPFGKRAPKELRDRPRIVFELLRRYKAEIHAMAVTKDGNPYHPLYLPMSTQPIPFDGWDDDGYDKILGYTLAVPLAEDALPEDAPFDEQYPYQPADNTPVVDPDTSTIDIEHARKWPTVTEALAFRAASKLFANGDIKAVRGKKRQPSRPYTQVLPAPSPLVGVVT
jgi:hypothetical protein